MAKENKAQKVAVLDLRKLSAFCDYFVIMSATSGRHITGLAQTIEQGLNKEKRKPLFRGSSSQNPESGWILLDYASVVVHIFQKPQREFYCLEHLWQDAKKVRIPSGNKRNGKIQSPRGSRVSNKRVSKKRKPR
ncbi:ribosome silencing factor [Candidatus Omnitrophota bacterium]